MTAKQRLPPPPSPAFKDPFRSERLIYRAIDYPADTDFYHSLHLDPAAAAQYGSNLLTPPVRTEVDEELKSSMKSLLAVIICLPPSSTSSSVSTTENADKSAGINNNSPGSSTTAQPIPIGILSLSDMRNYNSAINRRSNLSIHISSDYRSKGYGTEAIEWALNWGFRIAQLHKICIGALGYNTGAIRLYDRMGFVRESVKREHVWFDGEWWDVIDWGMLEDEWRERMR